MSGKVKNIPEESRVLTLYVKLFAKVSITFLCLILTLHNSLFYCAHCLQIMGCSMGTICAPPYAVIFMANFEEKHIYLYIIEMR